MNISNVSSASCSCQVQPHNGAKLRMQDFKALKSALESGDLEAAQKAFEAFQKDVQNSPRTKHRRHQLDPESAAGKDFQTLAEALKSGDIAAAKQAFDKFAQDLKTAFSHRAGHAHHRSHDDGDADDSSTTTTTGTVGVTLDQVA